MNAHPGEEALLRFTDDDLPARETTEVSAHLADCAECRERLENMREALGGYQRFHETVLKPSLAPAPRAWAPLRRSAVVRFPLKRVLAAAAAVAAVFLLVRRFEQPPAVKAAELLRKAVSAEQAAPLSRRRISVRTPRHSFVRPARLASAARTSGDAAAIQAQFNAAGYSWEDPLSAESFARWRDRLQRKQDHVTTVPESGAPQSYMVSTSTPDGELAEATVTLRARDLHAVSGTLKFRSEEKIEMTELADEAATEVTAQAEPLARPAAVPDTVATASPQVGPRDELRVMLALHRIGADLGEPLDIRQEGGAVVVDAVGLAAGRREEVRAALAGIPGVQLRFQDVHGHDAHPAPQPRATAPRPEIANPLVVELQAKLGGNVSLADLSDRLIDATDHAIERAYALRALARRFPAAIEPELNAEDARELRGLAADHVAALARSSAELRRLLAPVLPDTTAGSANVTARWQSLAESILSSLQELDQMLAGASGADGGAVARILARVDGQIAAMQGMLR